MLGIAFVCTNQMPLGLSYQIYKLSPQPDCKLLESKGLFLSPRPNKGTYIE